jgi:hypothetical protein
MQSAVVVEDLKPRQRDARGVGEIQPVLVFMSCRVYLHLLLTIPVQLPLPQHPPPLVRPNHVHAGQHRHPRVRHDHPRTVPLGAGDPGRLVRRTAAVRGALRDQGTCDGLAVVAPLGGGQPLGRELEYPG